MKKNLLALLSAAVSLSITFSAGDVRAAAFTPGDLVVVQVGDGVLGLTNGATPASLLEYSTLGSLIQTISLPTAVSGPNQPLTLSGTATSEGFLARSTDGQYLTMGGYAAIPGTVTPQTSAAGTVNRVVGRIDMSGNVNTTTALGDAYSGSNIRSAISTDGNSIWTTGNGGSGLGSTAASRYTTVGSTTSTQLVSTNTNMRVANIFNGQLYVSSSTGAFLGVSTVGTGEPTTGSQALLQLPGTATNGTHSAYDFWFKDASTLYIADDGGLASGGGIQKWELNAGTWSLTYNLLTNATSTISTRGLAGYVDIGGNAVLFGTSSTNSLFMVTDTGPGATVTTLAVAPLNTAFRGVEYLVPEPSTIVLASIGGLLLVTFLRRR